MKYTLKVTETKNKAGKFHYQVIDENGQVISERKSNREYVACTRNGGFYFGRLDLVGRGDHGRMIKDLYVQLAQTKLTDYQVRSNESAIARGDVPFYSIEKINAEAKAYLETYEAIATIAPVVAETPEVVAPKADPIEEIVPDENPIELGDMIKVTRPGTLFGKIGEVVGNGSRSYTIRVKFNIPGLDESVCEVSLGWVEKVTPVCQNAIEDNAGEPIEVGSYVFVEDEESEYYGAQGEVVKISGCEAQVALVDNVGKFLRMFRGSQLEKVLGPIEEIEEIEAIPASERMNLGPHTPGPWNSVKATRTTYEITARSGASLVARVVDLEDTLANARLLAAAPDMLEALRAARSLIKSTGVTEESRIGGKILKEINQAISKAIA